MKRKRVRVKRQTAEGKMWVRACICRPGEPDEELEDSEEIQVQTFEVEPAYVRIGAGVTKKIIEYESLRVDVAASIPCYREQMDGQADAAAEWVAVRLDAEVDKWLGTDEEGEDDGTSRTGKKKVRSKKKSKKKSRTKTRARRSRRHS